MATFHPDVTRAPTADDRPPSPMSEPAQQGQGGLAEAVLEHEQHDSSPQAAPGSQTSNEHETHESSPANSHDSPRSSDQEGDVEKGAVEETNAKTAEAVEKDKDPNLVDWDGPDDPMNPQNYAPRHKWAIVSMLSFMSLVTPLASSMFAPGVPRLLKDFNEPYSLLATFVVSVYVLGYAIGPLILSPMSECYGRLPVYHITNTLFIVFTIACAVASNFNMLIAFRFFEGCFGSAVITMGGGTIADLFCQAERGRAMALWSLGPLMGPVIGPIGGGFLAQAKGWRWVFWVITIAASAATILMAVSLRETYSIILLERKAARLRTETGNENLRSKHDKGETDLQRFKRSIVRPLKLLCGSPIVMMMALFMAVVYGYLYLLFTTITEVFETGYHFSTGTVGLTYLGIGLGMFIGLGVFGYLSDKLLKMKAAQGEMKPEYRLPPMVPGAICIPVGLFIYGWSAKFQVFWFVPILGTGFVGIGLLATFMPIQTYIVDAFTIYAASAIAALTVVRSMAGALLPMAGPSLYSCLGLGWGNSLLGFIALAMVPIPWFFIKYGERIRKHPKFQVKL